MARRRAALRGSYTEVMVRERISTWSLRFRLLLIALCALFASLLFGGVVMYWAASVQEDQMLDARLELLGATVLSFVEEELGVLDKADPAPTLALKTRPTAALLYRYQVWSLGGALLLRSHEAPADRPLMPLTRLGFDRVQIDGEEYRTFSLPTRNKAYVIQVAENTGERWTQTALVTFYYVGFLLVPLGLVFMASWLMMRRSLRSIDAMAGQLRHRNPLDLTPVEVADPPRELLPILRAVDTLFARVGHALSVERRFTSVAAHEMRTPLAGLRAHAQLASSATSSEDLQDSLKSLMQGADRAAHLLDQLLDLARIETLAEDASERHESIDLSDVYQDLMRELGPRAAARGLSFGARFPAPTLSGHRFALSLLLRNLVANAIHYTPSGGRIEVSTAPHDGGVQLCVDDSGPGIPAHERERAFERFNRLGQTQVQGVGLGLSIVLSVVHLHGAQLRLLDSPLGGLRVQVLFACGPAPTSVSPAAADSP
jgi:signal transduction histidine kinase